MMLMPSTSVASAAVVAEYLALCHALQPLKHLQRMQDALAIAEYLALCHALQRRPSELGALCPVC
jgi:hypothetical protein